MDTRKRYAIGRVLGGICVLSAAMAFLPATADQELPQEYQEAMALIGDYSGGDELERAAKLAEKLEADFPEAGYGDAIGLEMISIWRMPASNPEPDQVKVFLEWANKVVEAHPKLVSPYVSRARVLATAGRFDEATADIDTVLGLDPGNAEAVFRQADILRRQGQPEAAEAKYLECIAADPSPDNKRTAYYWAARTWQEVAATHPEQKEAATKRALGHFQSMVAEGSANPWNYVNFAIFLNTEIGDYAEAERWAGRALDLLDFPMARNHLALAKYLQFASRKNPPSAADWADEAGRIEQETGVSLASAVQFGLRYLQLQDQMRPLQLAAMRQQGGKPPKLDLDDSPSQEAYAAATFHEALAISDAQARWNQLDKAIVIWAQVDPLAALAATEQVEKVNEQQSLRDIVYSVGANRWPELMPELLATTRIRRQQETIVDEAMRALGGQDGLRAFGIARDLPDKGLRDRALTGVLGAWATKDPLAAAEAWASLSDREEQVQAMQRVTRSFALSDPDRALAWASELDGGTGTVTAAVLGGISYSDPEHALQALLELPSSADRDRMLASVLTATARTDPQQAARYSEALPDGALRTRIASNAAILWIRNGDPYAAFEWVLSQSNSVQVKALPEFGRYFAEQDLEFALGISLDSFPPEARVGWVSSLLREYAKLDAEAALEWIAPLSHMQMYRSWVYWAVGAKAEQDPLGAMDMADKLDAKLVAGAKAAVISKWQASDRESAAQYVEHMQPGDAKAAAASKLAYEWYGEAPEDAMAWANAISDARSHESALLAIVQLAPLDDATTLQIPTQIHDDHMRGQAWRRLIMRMMDHDPARAHKLFDSVSDLPYNLRKELEFQFQQRGI